MIGNFVKFVKIVVFSDAHKLNNLIQLSIYFGLFYDVGKFASNR